MQSKQIKVVSCSPDIAEMMLQKLGVAFDERVSMGDGLATVWRANDGFDRALVATLSACGSILTIV